jgi:hypothetical protein
LLQADQKALVDLEKVYFYNLQQAEIALAQIQKRTSEGKTILKFANRIQKIIMSVLNDFHQKLSGSNRLRRETVNRSRNLRDFILSSAQPLLDQQVQIRRMQVTKLFRKDLKDVYLKYDFGTDKSAGDLFAMSDYVKQSIQRKTAEFQSSLEDFQDDKLGLKIPENFLENFSMELEETAKSFPETTDAQFIEKQKMDKQVKKAPANKKKKKFGGFGASLSLVGMLRPPGFNNFQAFIGHANQLFGLPIDFVLGIQNDGDHSDVRK